MDSHWLRRFGAARTDAVQLVCFPHAGGSAGAYRWLSDYLSPQIDVLCLQYPGRLDRLSERPIDSMTGLATAVFEALRSATGNELVFFGHSMGSILAFEVARLVEGHGDQGQLAGLIVSGSSAPSRIRDEGVHRHGDEAFIAELENHGGANLETLQNEQLRALILPAVRADFKALENHRCGCDSTVSVPISVYSGTTDHLFCSADIDGWRHHTVSGCRFRKFHGGHFYLHGHEAEVAQAIAADLERFRVTEPRE